jgi:hypothetical protein
MVGNPGRLVSALSLEYLLLELFEYELLGCELDLVGVPVE